MPMNVISKRMGMGFPGQVARQSFNIIETHLMDPEHPVTEYGAPVVLDMLTGKLRAFGAGDTPTSIYGISVRPDAVQLGGDNPAAFSDSGTPDPNQPLDVLVKGYVLVKAVVPNPSHPPYPGYPVSVYTTAGGAAEIGTISAGVEEGKTTGWNGVKFMGSLDEYGIGEIRIL